MTEPSRKTGSDLFIVDNSDDDWKVVRYLHQWAEIAHTIDVATGYFEIGALLALDGQWQKLDKMRLLMGDEVSLRTKQAFEAGLANITNRLDNSLEEAKEGGDFLIGVQRGVKPFPPLGAGGAITPPTAHHPLCRAADRHHGWLGRQEQRL